MGKDKRAMSRFLFTSTSTNTSKWLLRALLGWLSCLLIVGCVSTQSGGFESKKDPKKTLEYSIEAARNYLQQGNFEAAKRHLKTALAIDDRNADVHETMAQVFWRTGETEQADDHFRRAVSLDSNNSRIRNNYAAFLYSQKRYREAEEQLVKVTADLMYEQRADAFINLGRVQLKLKNYAAAKDTLERALLMQRGNTETVFELAEVYYQLGDYGKAQQFYEGYRKQVPTQSAASLWLGIRIAQKFSESDTVASYALALKNLFPRSDEYLEYKGVYGDGGAKN
jgi:type IV pilus assembly protein PilF